MEEVVGGHGGGGGGRARREGGGGGARVDAWVEPTFALFTSEASIKPTSG